MRLLIIITLSACILGLSSGGAQAAFTQWSGSGPFATGDGNRVITALAVSPDGRALFAGSLSGTVLTEDLGFTMTVTVPSGPGTGLVSSDTGGITCASNNQGLCSVTYPRDTPVTLTATTPASNSTFTGWSQECSGFAPCITTMSNDHNVTAGFGLGPGNNGPRAKIASTGYDSIANAYSAAGAGATIMAVSGQHTVNTLLLDQGKSVILKGGYDALFAVIGLPSVLQGTVDIRSGSLRVDGVKMKP
jgi:WD40 repeat protein